MAVLRAEASSCWGPDAGRARCYRTTAVTQEPRMVRTAQAAAADTGSQAGISPGGPAPWETPEGRAAGGGGGGGLVPVSPQGCRPRPSPCWPGLGVPADSRPRPPCTGASCRPSWGRADPTPEKGRGVRPGQWPRPHLGWVGLGSGAPGPPRPGAKCCDPSLSPLLRRPEDSGGAPGPRSPLRRADTHPEAHSPLCP